MPDTLRTFLHWYLAPWRRIDRTQFGVALLIVSLPSLVSAFFMAQGAGGIVGALLDIFFAMKGLASGGDVGAALDTMSGAVDALDHGGEARGFAWMGFLNTLLLLGLFPLCRMRLRDMGKTGRQELGWAVVINLSVINNLFYSLLNVYVVPLGWLWSLVNFGGYVWLGLAKGAPHLAVHERMDYTLPQRKNDDD